MKRRFLEAHDGVDPELALSKALLALQTPQEARAFLRDLCTPAELEALTDRWRVVAPLWRGVPYREVHERSAVSVTTIGRVARFLTQGNGGYRALAERLYGPRGGAGRARPAANATADKRAPRTRRAGATP
jgi:TrpR-related protein YerC/YecD